MEWTTTRRGDKHGLVECVCECGVGHPAYGSALWIAESLHAGTDSVKAELDALMVHGCCGCCKRKDFPGTPIESLRHAHKLIRGYLERIAELEAKLDTNHD